MARRKVISQKKVVVFGAKGMLGSDVVSVFKEDGLYDVKGYDVDACDITKISQVRKVLKIEEPDVVINCAAFTRVDDCEDSKLRGVCFAVNETGPLNIAKVCKELDITLVHISTDYVFDGTRKGGYSERVHVKPVNAYGDSKAKGERAIKDNMKKFYIVRTSWLYGKNGPNFVKTMLDLSKKFSELKVVNDQHGKPTYTKHVARHLARFLKEQKPYGVYHFVNEGEATWYTFTKEIMKLAGRDIPVKPCTSEEFPRPAKRPENSVLYNLKFVRMPYYKKALKEYLKEIKVIK